jgi:tetratricopeptide (TPR) repeat protein
MVEAPSANHREGCSMKLITGSRYASTLIVACFVTLIVTGCAGDNPGVRAESAYKKLLKSQIRKAEYTSSESSKELPEMTSVDYERAGDMHFAQRNFNRAFIDYEKSLRLDPDNTRVHYKKGLLFTVAKMNDDAIKELQKVLAKDPKDALAHQALGLAFYSNENYQEAEKHLLKAVELDAKLWKARNILGVIYDHQKLYSKGLIQYKKAIAVKPDNGSLYNNLGLCYFFMRRYTLAVEAFRKASKLEPSSKRIHNNLALVHAKLHQYKMAQQAFRRGGDEAQAYNNLGCVYLMENEKAKAIQAFEKAMENKPTFYKKASDNLQTTKMLLSY